MRSNYWLAKPSAIANSWLPKIAAIAIALEAGSAVLLGVVAIVNAPESKSKLMLELVRPGVIRLGMAVVIVLLVFG